ncbi:MAG: hypothetical protein GWN01_15750 [Nitrosopumilaceae archaeon]|nr:hypothetical protein [Nitrosopumilaceae archaeon]NIU88748.1 hypothetical protein [Nitrosopumilaceae archaeon]NIV66883.1 hypothetical protein [Nitrosopumilaceae archaeon]NIX62897.1 hypothetical protein [Nitrosopumilaceae archaeon]
MLDHNTSAYFAVLELKYWLNYYGKDWEKVWASYNAGFNYKNGLKYSRDISNKIKQIDACIIKKQEVA